MENEPPTQKPAGRAPRTGETWKGLNIPEPLYEQIRSLANQKGISIALMGRKLLEAAIEKLKSSLANI